jgi:hypothetical protein
VSGKKNHIKLNVATVALLCSDSIGLRYVGGEGKQKLEKNKKPKKKTKRAKLPIFGSCVIHL